MNKTINETVAALEIIRQARCAYRAGRKGVCDCKHGVKFVDGKRVLTLPSGERGCGCPELRDAIGYLKKFRMMLMLDEVADNINKG